MNEHCEMRRNERDWQAEPRRVNLGEALPLSASWKETEYSVAEVPVPLCPSGYAA